VSTLLLRHVALPCLFLTSALLGGLRFEAETLALRFVAPPLATLLLATFLAVLFARAGLVDVGRDWLDARRPPIENLSNALTLATLFAATVQVFNAVIPEDTLFFAIFVLLFALVFWTGLFAATRPEKLVVSTGGLLLASFVVKYLLLVPFVAPSDSFAKTLVQQLLRGVTLGGVSSEAWAPATGYTAFASVALYVAGLWSASPPADPREELLFDALARRGQLTAAERRLLLEAAAEPVLSADEEAAIDAVVDEEVGR
jgi:hypothetical protein